MNKMLEAFRQFSNEHELIYPYHSLNKVADAVFHHIPDELDYPQCNYGWYPLIMDMLKELIDAGWNKQIAVIKQKFGYLEFYPTIPYSALPDVQQAIVRKYQERAKHTCELTGVSEDTGWWGDGWITCICRAEALKKCESNGLTLEDCWTTEHPLKVWAAKK